MGNQSSEHLWLVALFETESRAEELLGRLGALGIETRDATIVRVEVDDQPRSAIDPPPAPASAVSPMLRNAITGGLLGGAAAVLIGLPAYALDLLPEDRIEGLFNHGVLFYLLGFGVGGLGGGLINLMRPKSALVKPTAPRLPVKSEGFLVAVKMPPPLAEKAERIARDLGAKEVLV